MIEVVLKEQVPPVRVSVFDMPTGSLGVTDEGFIFLRTNYTATCLNNIGKTFDRVSSQSRVMVRILPPGSEIKIKVLPF